MANALLVFYRDSDALSYDKATVNLISNRLQPPSIQYAEPYFFHSRGQLSAVFDPCESLPVHNGSFCLGAFTGDDQDWHCVGAPKPDGSFALYRVATEQIELFTDALSSRTIWYYMDDDRFIASSSQRAIIMLLGHFDPDTSNYPWMLSSGQLNFMHCWDVRIHRLPLNSRLTIERTRWNLNVTSKPLKFETLQRSEKQLRAQFHKTVHDALHDLRIDSDRWLIPLSGGCDSRAIAINLSHAKTLHTITWGAPSSDKIKNSDAYIAQRISETIGSSHQFFELSSGSDIDNVEEFLHQFVNASEGGIDKFSGYADGFKVWRYIHKSNFDGVIRGEVVMSDEMFETDDQCFRRQGLFTLSEYSNLAPILGLLLQDMPQDRDPGLERQADETAVEFTQRHMATQRIPMVSAPLNAIKSKYCEIIAPLICQSVVDVFHKLPDHLQKEKNVFSTMVMKQLPNTPFATLTSIESQVGIVNSPAVADFLLAYLKAHMDNQIMSAHTFHTLLSFIETKRSRDVSKGRPSFLKRVARKLGRMTGFDTNKLDPMLIALRLYIILETDKMFKEDAEALR